MPPFRNSASWHTACFALTAFIAASPLHAQNEGSAFPAPPVAPAVDLPPINGFNPVPNSNPNPDLKDVRLDAVLTDEGPAVQHGLTWRVFSPIPGGDGKLPLLATSEGGSADFQLGSGEYFINVVFGRAGATKKIRVPTDGSLPKQVMNLDAGALVLNAVSGSDVRIPPKELTFSIYSSDVKEDGERALVSTDVKPSTVVRLNSGTYHIVSDYGDVNAVIRADIQVEAGKMTEATIQHRAAKLTLKLVSEAGGEAIADTKWSILASSGDVISESVGAFPTVVLAEGNYIAIARNKDKFYQRDFNVQAGVNTDIEVLLDRDAQAQNTAD